MSEHDSRSPSRQSEDYNENDHLIRHQPQNYNQGQGGQQGGLGGLGNAVGEVTGNLNKSLSGLNNIGGIAGGAGSQGGQGGDNDVAMKKLQSRKPGGDVNGNALAPLLDNRTEEQKRLDDVGKKYKDDKSSLKIRIELDIDVEVHLSARVKGDITIGLL